MKIAEITTPELMDKVAAAKSATRSKSLALRTAVNSGNNAEAANLTKWFLSAEEPRLYFAMKLSRSGKVKPKPTIAECLSLVHSLDFRSVPTEKVRLALRKKHSGKPRIILSFGLMHRVAQETLRLVLSGYHRPQPFQYTHRGVKKAIGRTRDCIAAGNVWFAHLDIKEFYPSFRYEKLEQDAALGGILPSKTLAGFVCGRNLKVYVNSEDLKRFSYLSRANLQWEARRGIPTGSCLSSVIAPMMVSRLQLDKLVSSRTINYEDDFLLVAPSEAELKETVDACKAALKNLPGGRFSLKTKSVGMFPSSQISFLGHRIYSENGVTCIGPNASNEQNFWAFLADFDDSRNEFLPKPGIPLVDQRLSDCRRVVKYLQAWASAFSLCGSVAKEMVTVGMIQVENELAMIGKTVSDLGILGGPSDFVASEHFEYSGLH